MNPIQTQTQPQGVVIRATLDNIFKTPERRDNTSGEIQPGKWKLQLSYPEPMKNGETRIMRQDITVPEAKIKEYQGKQGKQVEIPCGTIVRDNRLYFFGL